MTAWRDGSLGGRFLFLSASAPSRDLELYPRLQMEVEDAVIHLARAVLTKGGRLVFGGHPSISPLVASVAREYLPPNASSPRPARPIQIFQSDAYKRVIPPATSSLEDFGYASIHWTPAKNGEEFDPEKDKSQCKSSLRFMREEMLKLEPLAMVAIGGMDGVAEEAGLFLEKTAGRVFALRTTGGVSGELRKHTGEWLGRQDRPVFQGLQEQLEQRIVMLEDEFPATELPAQSQREGMASAFAPYGFYLQKMVRGLLEKRWS
jgi:hypothetical protein